DLRTPGRSHFFVPEKGLFVQALAGPYAGVANLDVASDLQSREADQVGCEVGNPNRLAHVEDVDPPTMTQRARLEHNPHGHVLVGCRVEARVGAQPVKHAGQTRPVPHVGDHRRDLKGRVAALQLLLDVEDLVLAVAEQYEVCRFQPGELSGQFTADRASSPG